MTQGFKRPDILSTGDVAEHCGVSYETVKNWIKAEKLVAWATPGKHHKIALKDFQAFCTHYGFPQFLSKGRVNGTVPQKSCNICTQHTICDIETAIIEAVAPFNTKAMDLVASCKDFKLNTES